MNYWRISIESEIWKEKILEYLLKKYFKSWKSNFLDEKIINIDIIKFKKTKKMKKDPFYVKDSLTEQIEREEQKKREQRKAFMDEQKRYYKEYLAKKDKNKYEKINNIISTQPIKITDNNAF